MRVTQKVKRILDWYKGDPPGVKANIARILSTGKLGGTGKVVILPVDQGFEHGPARSFAPNPPAYDPHYHYQLAIEAGLSAYAAPLGMIAAGADTFAGQIPTILKCNNANSLATNKDQAVTAGVKDALRLGCAAIGFTIYPGSEYAYDQMEELRELTAEAKAAGLAVVVWSYPRGGNLDRAAETALDICAYATQMAALMGANIIKVKPPTAVVCLEAAKKAYEKIDGSTLAKRVEHVMQLHSTADASWCSPAARPRISTVSMRRSVVCATAAPTAASLVATPSSARKKRRWKCSNKIIDIYLGKA